jgi:hypothetical protein
MAWKVGRIRGDQRDPLEEHMRNLVVALFGAGTCLAAAALPASALTLDPGSIRPAVNAVDNQIEKAWYGYGYRRYYRPYYGYGYGYRHHYRPYYRY